MKEYQLRWQTLVGAVLLFMLWITIFFPGLSISADQYIDSAVTANRYALEKDEDITAAREIAEGYEQGGLRRAGAEKSYRRKLYEMTGGDASISRLYLAKWALTVKEHLEFEGIQFKEGRQLKDTGIKSVLRLWGWLIYMPFLAAMISMVFMLAKGRTFAGALLFDGALAAVCECISHFAIPSMLWDKGRHAVFSFELVGSEALNQRGTGEVFIRELLSRCSGAGWIIIIIISALIVIYSIVCLVMQAGSSRERNQTGGYTFSQEPGIWDRTKSMRKREAVRETGILRGLKGEYAGQSIEIRAGEEIILGRDPEYCMLIFCNPKVSRRQCGIRYDALNGCYQAVDFSTGGTTLSNGTLLAASEYTSFLSGTVIHMADDSEIFMVM